MSKKVTSKQATIKKHPSTAKKPQRTAHRKDFMKVYWPYLPLFILVFFGMVFGYNWRTNTSSTLSGGRTGVLAYATNVSVGGLLSATNGQRSQNGGLTALTLNSQLSSAAQAKANDMVARNYWSHTTPDGKDPWVFIEATGYNFQKAGENLAYGFLTSDETVVGWMNSPGHRANILDSGFKEVGFGFANAASFVGSGEETVVVAMYASPVANTPAPEAQPSAPATLPSTTQKPAPSQPSQQPTSQSSPSQPTNQDTTIPVTDTSKEEQKDVVAKDRYNQPVTSENEIPAAQPATRITKLQTITAGYAPWSAAALSGLLVLVVGLWAMKHAIIVKKVFIDGEKFVLHHPLFDVAVLIVVGAAIILSQSSGVVK